MWLLLAATLESRLPRDKNQFTSFASLIHFKITIMGGRTKRAHGITRSARSPLSESQNVDSTQRLKIPFAWCNRRHRFAIRTKCASLLIPSKQNLGRRVSTLLPPSWFCSCCLRGTPAPAPALHTHHTPTSLWACSAACLYYFFYHSPSAAAAAAAPAAEMRN